MDHPAEAKSRRNRVLLDRLPYKLSFESPGIQIQFPREPPTDLQGWGHCHAEGCMHLFKKMSERTGQS